MDLGFRMHAERTPNPNSIKWVVSRSLVEPGRGAYFEDPPGPEVSPLADRLFAVDGVTGVFVAPGFITVTKGEAVEWTDIAQALVDAIKAHVESGERAVAEDYRPHDGEEEGGASARIREIIDTEIRPAVAMDGGDITFADYSDGVVRVHLQGSCSGCPSSTATLKMGIEARLREEIPELVEVVAL